MTNKQESTTDAKSTVLDKFLDFVSQYLPLKRCRLVTLGGKGIEAKVWEQRGIIHSHGTLIESNHKKAANIISCYRYQYHDRLQTFGKALAERRESDSSIDGFHLDLCGNLNPEIMDDFRTSMSFIFKSIGRCLAVTVSDQRRHTTLEDWPALLSRARSLFGEQTDVILKTISIQQKQLPVGLVKEAPQFMRNFDHDKAARREFATLVECVSFFQNYSAITLDKIARYVYVSRYSNRPFRMRTYFFRFDYTDQPMKTLDFVQEWLNSPLYFVRNDQVTPIKIAGYTQSQTQTQTKGPKMPSRLKQLAEILGGSDLEEYNSLVRDAEILAAFRAAMNNTGIAGLLRSAPSTPSTNGETAAPVVSTEPKPAPRRSRPLRAFESLSDERQIEWTLNAIERRVTCSDREWPMVKRSLIEAEFGYFSDKLNTQMRAVTACAGGGLRKRFIAKIERTFPGDAAKPYLDRLSKLPLSIKTR